LILAHSWCSMLSTLYLTVSLFCFSSFSSFTMHTHIIQLAACLPMSAAHVLTCAQHSLVYLGQEQGTHLFTYVRNRVLTCLPMSGTGHSPVYLCQEQYSHLFTYVRKRVLTCLSSFLLFSSTTSTSCRVSVFSCSSVFASWSISALISSSF